MTGQRLGGSARRRLPSAFLRIACLLICAGLFATNASAQTATSVSGSPANSVQKPHGGGWTCDRGFEEADKACVKAGVPEYAHLAGSVHGAGQECNYGSEPTGETCAPGTVPVNAYLDGTGTRWDCDRGVRPGEGGSTRIVLPGNAYLTDAASGPGWTCDPGYAAKAGGCASIKVPEFAHLNSSGDGWQCKRACRQAGRACAAP